jgi:hypothetical protein
LISNLALNISRTSTEKQMEIQKKKIGYNTWRRMVHKFGALEYVLAVGCREHEIILGKVVPHESVLVAPEIKTPTRNDQHPTTVGKKRRSISCAIPLAGPRIHGGHALPAHRVQMVNHI